MVFHDFVSHVKTTNINRIAVFMLVALLGIGLGVGFSIATSNAQKASEADYDRVQTFFSQWQTDLTTRFSEAKSVALTLAAFATTDVNAAANLTAPATDRIVILNQEAFDRIGRQVYVPGVTSMSLAPGGVISQTIPVGTVTFGLDLLNDSKFPVVAQRLYYTDDLLTTGPDWVPSRSAYAFFVWSPIHVSNVTTQATFWGFGYVVIEVDTLLNSLNITSKLNINRLDYVMWVGNGSDLLVIGQSTADPDVVSTVMAEGLRMELPTPDDVRNAYIAMHPRGGYISPLVPRGTIAVICLATIFGTLFVVLFVYACALLHFMFRHRRAPASKSSMFVAAIALRGAQPIADHAPLVAVRMFNEFTIAVRLLAKAHGCYPVCEIGDRCVYVVSKDPAQLLKLAQAVVLDVSIHSKPTVTAAATATATAADHRPSVSYIGASKTAKTRTMSRVSEDLTQSSFIGTTTCHAAVACHTMTAIGVYDQTRDCYFFGTSSQLARLCSALDLAKSGEVCWTGAFEANSTKLCRGAACAALSAHTISENDEVVLHVASWWKDDEDDEADNDDPSTAMAVLSDAYVRRMTVIVSEGKAESKARRKKDGNSSEDKTSSNRSAEATLLTRTATILHVSIMGGSGGEEKMALDTVRRIVAEEKGAVVSAHEATIVVAFNLMSAGGHHQVRAADTVMRLRDALPSTRFAASIHYGKVGALVADGLVMCTGSAVAQGRALLEAAITLSSGQNTVAYRSPAISQSAVGTTAPYSQMPEQLCLLSCQSDLSSSYDCEAIDVAELAGSKETIVYRLAFKRATKANDDEWMYRMKDEEELNPFALANIVFSRIIANDFEGAKKLVRDGAVNGVVLPNYSIEIISRHVGSL